MHTTVLSKNINSLQNLCYFKLDLISGFKIHKSKKSEILGRCGRQNMLQSYLKVWDWDLIFGRAVKVISSPGVRSPWIGKVDAFYTTVDNCFIVGPTFFLRPSEPQTFFFSVSKWIYCIPRHYNPLLIRNHS